MQMIEGRHELAQIELVFLCKALLAQPVVRIQIVPVMSCTKWDGREVGGLLPQSPGSQCVSMGSFDNGHPAAHF